MSSDPQRIRWWQIIRREKVPVEAVWRLLVSPVTEARQHFC